MGWVAQHFEGDPGNLAGMSLPIYVYLSVQNLREKRMYMGLNPTSFNSDAKSSAPRGEPTRSIVLHRRLGQPQLFLGWLPAGNSAHVVCQQEAGEHLGNFK